MKTLKILTIELLILTITIASFIGVYKKDEYRVRNLIPDYKKGMNFGEKRLLTFSVDDTVKETLIYDKDGNLVENEEEGIEYTEENGYKIVEVKTNSQDVLNEANYNKTKNILLNRLSSLSVGEYEFAFDKETGKIEIRIPENDNSDAISYYLEQSGKFEITDSQTGELLLDGTHLKDVGLIYGSNLNDEAKNESYVYLQLKFDKTGTEKINELSKIYVSSENHDEENEEDNDKKVSISLNGANLGSTVITNILYNNTITISLGYSDDQDEFAKQSENATNIVKILKSGTLPIVYAKEEKVLNAYDENNIKFEYYELSYMVLSILICIYLVIKYRTRGMVAGSAHVGFLALLLIVLRVTNVTVTESGIVGIIIGNILNFLFLKNILNTKNKFNNELIRHFLVRTTNIYNICIFSIF